MTKKKTKWIDISLLIKTGMVNWPSDPPTKIERVSNINKGDECNLSLLSFGSHTGTHMDAPLHFIKKAKGLDQIPLDVCVGTARVITIKDKESIKVDEIKKYRIRRGEKILFKTENSKRCFKGNKFIKNFVYLSTDAAKYLSKIKVTLVGIDYLSVGGYKENGSLVHNALLKSGVWLLEGLDLSKTRNGNCKLICLPLKIFNSDGAPARAIISQG